MAESGLLLDEEPPFKSTMSITMSFLADSFVGSATAIGIGPAAISPIY